MRRLSLLLLSSAAVLLTGAPSASAHYLDAATAWSVTSTIALEHSGPELLTKAGPCFRLTRYRIDCVQYVDLYGCERIRAIIHGRTSRLLHGTYGCEATAPPFLRETLIRAAPPGGSRRAAV